VVGGGMAEEGAAALVLVGRKGAATEDACQAVRELEARGTRVLAAAVDVADAGALDRLLTEVRMAWPPLKGVLHAATVLDALAWRRRAEGRPALSVNWGALADIGVAARDPDLLRHLERTGVTAMPPRLALEALGRLLRDGRAVQIGVMDVDWRRWGQASPAGARSPRFAAPAGLTGAADHAAAVLVRRTVPEERPAQVVALLTEEVSRTVRIPADRIDTVQPLTRMGVDSLMAVELQTAIQIAFGVDYSSFELTSGQGIAQIAGQLLDRMGLSGVAAPAAAE
jgi:acyl carrier protein